MSDVDPRIKEVRERFARSAFHAWMGMVLGSVSSGEVEVAIDAESHHLNLMGTLHGGVLATLADTATGLAFRTTLEPGTAFFTSSLSLTFLAVGAPGRVTATGTVLRHGRRFGYAEADVVDAEGTLLARATTTFTVFVEREA